MQPLDDLPLPQLFEALVDEAALRTLLRAARDEDLGSTGDITTALSIPARRRGAAQVTPRSDGVVAGLAAVPTMLEVFDFGGTFESILTDGSRCAARAAIARLEGSLREILTLERTMLNLLCRLSGIATATRSFVDLVRATGSSAIVVDTRKTTPAWRTLEKYAVRCGGAGLHRIGLFDAVLLKDNHLAGVTDADLGAFVAEVALRARRDPAVHFIEVEVDRLEQLDALLHLPEGVVDIVLLDNMDPAQLADAVTRRGARRRPFLEASGGVRRDTIEAIARSGVDRIAVGSITHSSPALDLGLDIDDVSGPGAER